MVIDGVTSDRVVKSTDTAGFQFLFQAVWEGAIDAMVLSNADGTVIAVNPAYCALYRHTPQNLVGQSFAVIFPEEQRAQAEEEYRRYFADHVHPEGVEAWVQTGDGSERLVDVRYSFIERDGQRVAMLSVIRDVTERARLQQSEHDLLREKDNFLLAVSHDLKTPIAAIKGHAQLLLRRLQKSEESDPPGLVPGLQQIETSATRISRMIDGLLDASSMRSGEGPPLHRQSLDLVALIQEVVNDHPTATDRDRVVIEASHPIIGLWDRDRVERVIANLLSNALKYSPGGGTVRISLHDERLSTGTEAVLCVQDQGIGIPETDRERIFEPFYRGRNVDDGIAGSGIGLASVRQIVALHGGTVSIESVEGEGSTITVRLPVGAPSQSR